jgi:hypothetical protein
MVWFEEAPVRVRVAPSGTGMRADWSVEPSYRTYSLAVVWLTA